MSLRVSVLCLLTLTLAGCTSQSGYSRSDTDAALFGPAAMRVHPIFTQVKDWTGDGRADGIDALVELQDQFGDPTKASGQIIFELFEYRPYYPETRGQRVVNPWIGKLETLEQQRARWNRTSRTYSFQLEYPDIKTDQGYVLSATFELSNGGRFFDQIILEARPTTRPSPPGSTTQPTPAPTTAATQPAEGPATRPAQHTFEP